MADRWALVTGAGGHYRQLLDIARPSFRAYAERWNMDYVESTAIFCAWDKPQAIYDELRDRPGVVWLDADCVIVDGSEDIRREVESWQWGWVYHGFAHETVPNCGVLVIPHLLAPALVDILDLRDRYEEHPWWDQAGALDVFGWNPVRGACRKVSVSDYHEAPIPARWNVLPVLLPCDDPAIIHTAGTRFEDRVRIMREAAKPLTFP